jgi:hypothetical protein
MRVIIALAVLGLSLGGCSHPYQRAYAKPLPSPHLSKASRVKAPQLSVRKIREAKASSEGPPQLSARKIRQAKASSVEPPPLPVRKIQELRASSVKPPPLPVRKFPESTKVSSVKPPPLPLRKPEQVSGMAEAKFKAAQAKAKLGGVHTLTKQDIDGLSPEQIKALRGY